MNQFEVRMRVQSMIDDQVMKLINVNCVSPSVVEDALNKILVRVKDLAYQEFLTSITVDPAVQSNKESQENREE